MRPPAALALLIIAPACFPFALPPGAIEGGAGMRRDHGITDPSYDAPLQARASVNPLQAIDDYQGRWADFGLGGFIDSEPSAGQVQRGAFLEVGIIPVRVAGDGNELRLTPKLQGRLLYDPALHQFGQGVAAQLQCEIISFSDGAFNETSGAGGTFGVMHGEGGVGLYLETSLSEIGHERIGTLSGGLLIRIPAMVGFVWGIPK